MIDKYIKTPFNWVGNKYKYLNTINKLIKNKSYNNIYDLCMGSGNILINLECNANKYIGIDIIKLLPSLYMYIKKNNFQYSINIFSHICENYNNFTTKSDYYNFRADWNIKYFNNIIDEYFIYETIILLKMCSNSMIRFNSKGLFNQGFRGTNGENAFFKEKTKDNIINELIILQNKIKEKNFEFYNMNFKDIKIENNSLLIIDPPYVFEKDMYSNNFSKEDDEYLLNLIKNTNNEYIYFNYIKSQDKINIELQKFIYECNPNIIFINNKTHSGQNRKNPIKDVEEILITNIKI